MINGLPLSLLQVYTSYVVYIFHDVSHFGRHCPNTNVFFLHRPSAGHIRIMRESNSAQKMEKIPLNTDVQRSNDFLIPLVKLSNYC